VYNMLLLKYMDSYFDYNLHTNVKVNFVCDICRNLISLYGTYIGVYSLYIYYQYNIVDHFEYGGLLIVKTMMLDFIFIKDREYSTYFHHGGGFYILFLYHYYNFQINSVQHLVIILFLTEVSTIFLRIRDISKSCNIYTGNLKFINNNIFALTFFYTRVYNYTNVMYLENGINDIVIEYNIEYPIIFSAPFHGLYILNLYWFYLILKICLKEYFKININ